MPLEMPTLYDPTQVEKQAYDQWLKDKSFHAEPSANGDQRNYAIVIPPPNVTGALHMGHALNNTIQDILIRFRRMQGCNTLWMPGTDHAGIATQTVVEKRVLAEEGKRRIDFDRDEFVEKIEAWKDQYETRITEQLHAMGCSCDWERQRFTMDETCAKAVREAFFRLFKDGLIYRGKRLVNWDPATQTALADDEVEMQEIDGHFWYLNYPLTRLVEVDGQLMTHVTVATTRPETMLGDTAVAINPKDPRAAALTGKFIKLPIVNRIIPIVLDDYVVLPDPNSDDAKARFATGFLKVTPAHDPNDWEIGKRHDLGVINVMAPNAAISHDHGWREIEENVHEAASMLGMDRFEAREAIVSWFRSNNLLEEVKPYTHTVGHSYRSHVPIEPYLSDQWYVKVTDDRLAGAALRAMNPEQRSTSNGCVWKVEHHSTSPDRQGGGIAQKRIPSISESKTRIYDFFFITFTTYGTWLHGDARGSVDREHNLPGDPYLPENPNLEAHEDTLLKNPPVTLDHKQRTVVRDTIQKVCCHRQWPLYACNVRTNHVHVVVLADDKPEKILNTLKSYATRRLREADLMDNSTIVWSRHGSTRYLNSRNSLAAACHYVLHEQGKDSGAAAGEQAEPVTYAGDNLDYISQKERCSANKIGDEQGESSSSDNSGRGPLPDGRGSLNANPSERRESACGYDWEGGLTFYPDRYAKTFQTWHENLRDWCISRQLWWGHRIPVWRKREKWSEVRDNYGLFEMIGYAGLVDIPSKPTDWIQATSKEGYHGRVAAQLRYTVDIDQIAWLDQFVCVAQENEGIEKVLEQSGFERDPDVLDTWFSSALWPLSTMGWPDETELLKAFNPGSVLCTAREIITLWVSRMVMFNLYFRDCLPFNDVFIHAMIQDGQGQKMSKSLGNGVDPLDIIHSHGADAMRFTLASMTTLTQDVRMPVDVVCPHTGETFEPKMITNKAGYRVTAPIQICPTDKSKKFATSYGVVSGEVTLSDELPLARNTSSKFDTGRNFSNKLWNASRFALMNLVDSEEKTFADGRGSLSASSLAWEDRWILSQLAQTAQTVTNQLENYKFSETAGVLYRFFWNDLCDWYLEIIKPRMRDDALKPIAQKVLAYVLDATLRLLHPIIPFITENIYRQLNALYPNRNLENIPVLSPSESLINAPWPGDLSDLICDSIVAEMDLCQLVVRLIREIRIRYQVPPRQSVEVSIKAADTQCVILSQQKRLLCNLTNLSDLTIATDTTKPSNAAVAMQETIEVYVHNVIDTKAEKKRLLKQKEEIAGFISNSEKKLANENFVSRAKPEVVQRERDRLTELQNQLTAIEVHYGE